MAIVIYPHLPKTGGQSLMSHLGQHMQLYNDFVILSETFLNTAESGGRERAIECIKSNKHIQIVFGHDVSIDVLRMISGDYVFGMTIRNHASLYLSYYNFRMSMENFVPFWRFYHARMEKNFIAKWIVRHVLKVDIASCDESEVYGLAKYFLRQCEFIADTQILSESTLRLMQYLDIPALSGRRRINVSGVHHGKRITMKDDFEKILLLDNPYDFALYYEISPLSARNA